MCPRHDLIEGVVGIESEQNTSQKDIQQKRFYREREFAPEGTRGASK
jgi:hypothetical protein